MRRLLVVGTGRGGAEASGDEAGEAGRGQIVQDFYAMSRNLHFLQRELGTRRRVESRTVTAQTWHRVEASCQRPMGRRE